MDWKTLDWRILDRLRGRFLDGNADGAPYWQSGEDLAHYDFTYARRIGWKWDAVLSELRLRGWSPSARSIVDFGCGSGIAGRRVIGAFGRDRVDELILWDHSALAMDFAEASASRAFPGISVVSATRRYIEGESPVGLLLLSHLLNELTEEGLTDVRRLVERSSAVIWVEPGTSEVARGLRIIHDEFRRDFDLVAPCTHQLACPMGLPGNERHWCHFFAPPPPDIFADGDWVRFGQRAGIDLRSLPYSFLVLQRRGAGAAGYACDSSLSRIIGRPESLKPCVRFLDCSTAGLRELRATKRHAPHLCRKIERAKGPLLGRWTTAAGSHEITEGDLMGQTSDPSGKI